VDYQQAIDFLYPLHRFGIRPGLERIRQLLAAIGHPERRIGRVAHIAGTNGKGTVAACLASIFHASGRRTGLFTSPHLVDFTERIRIDGRPIPREKVAGFCSRLSREILDSGATFFEATTAMALDWFAEEEVAVSVIETGMGGRLDATNAVTGDIVIIPSIGLDHTAWLGGTIRRIAAEKAAIVKPGCRVYTAVEGGEALDEIGNAAARCEAPLRIIGRDASCHVTRVRPGLLELGLRFASGEERQLKAPLTGSFHSTNIALAVMAAREDGVGWEPIGSGLLSLPSAGYRARLEVVSTRPFIMLDVSHNPDGMAKSVEALIEIRDTFRDLYVLAGVAADKDAAGMVRHLASLARMVATVELPTDRSLPAAELAGLCRMAGIGDVREAASVAEGLALLRSAAGPEDLILATGSFYLAGELAAGWPSQPPTP
jgi:dihydrofolate synthase/folylpolyglutamate synthase